MTTNILVVFVFDYRATLVGLAYGYATILSSSLLVPMASHAINNLIGGVIWRVTLPNNREVYIITLVYFCIMQKDSILKLNMIFQSLNTLEPILFMFRLQV